MPTRKDKTNVAPIYREQVFIPASGATLIKQQARPKIAGRPVSSGAIETVSPEFDLLTGIRGIANLPKGFLKTNKLPQGENLYYRQLDKSSKGLERAKQVGVIDTKSAPPTAITLSSGKTIRIGKTFNTPFFAKGHLWYDKVDDMDVIVGKDNPLLDWKTITKGGGITRPTPLNTRRTPFYMGESNQAPTELFELYRRYPGIGYRNVTYGFPTIPITGLNTAAEQMKCGGRCKAKYGLDIQYGGRAIPITRNMVYFDGNSHSAGGIGVGNDLEVEGGEVGEKKGNTLRIFSAVPFLGGASPAQLVMGGANPNTVFKAQEAFKNRNRINDDGTRYQNGGKKKSNSAIRTEADKKVSTYNKAIYSAVDATSDYPKWWQAIGLGAGSNLKAIINPDTMNYSVTDSIADAAWRKRLGLSYDNKHLIDNKDGSVRLPKHLEREIPTDTIMLKKRIIDNEKFANQSNIVGEDWKIVQSMIDKDKEALNALRKTYKTGEPVVINEYAHNSRNLSKDGELIKDAINYKSPLNIMRNYTIQYNPKTKQMEYRDMYDFNEFEWGVPGKPFEIKGSIPLKRFGGNMIYEINGNVKNGLMNTRDKAQYGKEKKINEDTKIGDDGLIYKRDARGKWWTDGTTYQNSKYYMRERPVQSGGKRSTGEVVKPKVQTQSLPEVVVTAKAPKSDKIIKPNKASKFEGIKLSTLEEDYMTGKRRSANRHPIPDFIGEVNKGKGVVSSNVSSTPRKGETKSTSSKATTKSTPTLQDTINQITRDAIYKSNTSKIDLSKAKMPTFDVSQLGSKETKAVKTKLNTSSTGGGKQSNSDGRWIPQFNSITTRDWIGLGSNLAGHIASYFTNNALLSKYPMPTKPVMAQAAKLKTTHNINPELTNNREVELTNRDVVRRNTQSSNTSIAREQRIMNEARNARNQLYGRKENIETQLINQDRLNRQSVYQRNVAAYNDWLDKTFVAKNNKLMAKQQNMMNLISGIPMAVNNIIGNIESRQATNNTIKAIDAANPNVDGRLLGIGDYYTQRLRDGRVAVYNKNGKLKKYV